MLAGVHDDLFDSALAERHDLRSIAFPSISTGAYGFPIPRAARIAIKETKSFLERNRTVESVRLICFGASALKVYQDALTAEPNT